LTFNNLTCEQTVFHIKDAQITVAHFFLRMQGHDILMLTNLLANLFQNALKHSLLPKQNHAVEIIADHARFGGLTERRLSRTQRERVSAPASVGSKRRLAAASAAERRQVQHFLAG